MLQHSSISNFDEAKSANPWRWMLSIAIVVAMIGLTDHVLFARFAAPVHLLLKLSEQQVSAVAGMLSSSQTFDVVAVGSSMTNSGFSPARFQKTTGLSAFNAGIANNTFVNRSREVIDKLITNKKTIRILYAVDSFSFTQPPSDGPLNNLLSPQHQPRIVNLFYLFSNKTRIVDWVNRAWRGQVDPFPADIPQREITARFATFDSAMLNDNGWLEVRATARPDFSAGIKDTPFYDSQINQLREVVRATKRAGIELILMQLPEYKSALEETPDRYRRFNEVMQHMAKSEGVQFLNFSADPAFPYQDNSFFYDVNHLNAKGADLFTEILADRLKRNGFFPSQEVSRQTAPK